MYSNRRSLIDELNNLKSVLKGNVFDEKGRLKYDYSFSAYSPIYLSTTENIKDYVRRLDLEGKKVLVPAASGDHALECILNGASRVDTFDINSYAFHMQNLKIAGIKALSREEFVRFFYKYNISYKESREMFSLKLYKKIRSFLPDNSKMFWDKVYLYTKDQRSLLHSYLLLSVTSFEDTLLKQLDYISEENFQIIKNLLLNFNTSQNNEFNCDIYDLCKLLKDKYDVILLSNISDYARKTPDEMPSESLRSFREYVRNDLSKFVKSGGMIVSEYKFMYSDVHYNNDEEHEIWELPFSYNNKSKKDAVFVYKK